MGRRFSYSADKNVQFTALNAAVQGNLALSAAMNANIFGGPTLVQQMSRVVVNNDTDFTMSFSSGMTAGNRVVLACMGPDLLESAIETSYAPMTRTAIGAAHHTGTQTSYDYGISLRAATFGNLQNGATTFSFHVTVQFYGHLWLGEFSGLQVSDSGIVDLAIQTNDGTTSPYSKTSASPTASASDLIFSMIGRFQTGAIIGPSGYTDIFSSAVNIGKLAMVPETLPARFHISTKATSAIETPAVSATGVNDHWALGLFALKGA